MVFTGQAGKEGGGTCALPADSATVTMPAASTTRVACAPSLAFRLDSSVASKQVASSTFCERALIATWLSTSVADAVSTAVTPSCTPGRTGVEGLSKMVPPPFSPYPSLSVQAMILTNS